MSQFDPASPGYVPPGNVVNNGDQFTVREGNQTSQTLLAVGTILSASTAVTVTNFGCRGAIFTLDIASFPGSASTTVALKINVIGPGARTQTIATRATLSTSGMSVLVVYPGISASAGGVSSPLPKTFSVQLSLSTGATSKEVALSLGMMRIV